MREYIGLILFAVITIFVTVGLLKSQPKPKRRKDMYQRDAIQD